MSDIDFNAYAPLVSDEDTARVTSTRRLKWVSYTIILVGLGGFAYWAATAPLQGAAIAQGTVAVEDDNRLIQHLEGGIVDEIHVREGQTVSAGEPLVTLDATASRSEVLRLEKQWLVISAMIARLRAERDGQSAVIFSEETTQMAATLAMQATLDEQVSEFDVRRERMMSEDEILQKRVTALQESVKGLEAQKTALAEQINVLGEEVTRKEALLNKGLTVRSEYTDLVRARADLVGRAGAIEAEIASANTQILEAEEQIQRQKTVFVEDAINEMNSLRTRLADIEEQLNSTRDILTRTVVRAPSDGYVVRMGVNTKGSVVSAGGAIAELLPTGIELGITARVPVSDIDLIRPGQDARLRMVALNQRTTPEAQAHVAYVSPDRIVDEKTGEPYYEVRLLIDELPEGIKDADIYPGMPVEALISTQERTFFEYVSKPILDSMSRAFREE